MTDEQLVSALITSYKNRGVDMSYLLSDPLFDKLPAASKIKAVQTHAGDLAGGISDRMGSGEYKRLGFSTAYNALRGATIGAPIGAALAAKVSGGMTPVGGALRGAAALGLVGGLLGVFEAKGRVGVRRDLKTALTAVKRDPSVPNAIGALSESHMTEEARSLRDKILDRISGDLHSNAKENIENSLNSAHEILLKTPSVST